MKLFYLIRTRIVITLLLLLACTKMLIAQGPPAGVFNILPVNGNYSFPYNQVPEDLVSVNPNLLTGTIDFQWESSLLPLSGFTSISGAISSTYTFSSPLLQTTYFRRRAIITLLGFHLTYYSNILKINVVSQAWEDRNYVREHDVLIAGQNDWKAIDALPIGSKLQTTTYMDGIGRPVQKVSRETALQDPAQPNNLWGDVVQFTKFDTYGRPDKQYLPYTTTTESGKYKTTAATEQPQYYSSKYNETAPYNRVSQYDNSPLNRALKTNQSGTSWTNSAGSSVELLFNDATDNVQDFTIDYTSTALPVSHGTYADRTLYKTIYTDENGKNVIEFTDKSGKLILKKVQLDDAPADVYAGWICTYNVYDDFGQLRFVVQPEGVKWLADNNWDFTATNGQTVADEWCFRYEYDDEGRTTLKKAPGAKELYMLYDKRGRMVFMQDGNQRLQPVPEWTVNLYDELDRPVITALYHTATPAAVLQTSITDNPAATGTSSITNPSVPITDLVVNHRETSISLYAATNSIEFVADASGNFESPDNDNFTAEIDPAAATPANLLNVVSTYNNPISNTELANPSITTIVKYFFYDTYNYNDLKVFSSSFDNAQAYPSGADPMTKTQRTTNMLTGIKVRVLNTNNFLTSSFYYDEKGRPLQTLEDNIKSGVDVTTNQYQFDDRLLSTAEKHTAAGSEYSNYAIVTKYIFDKIGRATSLQKKFGGNPFTTIAGYDLDDMGRLKTKHLAPGYTNTTTGKEEMESLTYSYNIHDQFTGINKQYALKAAGYDKWDNYFGLCLGFDKDESVFAATRRDGSVSGLLWNTQGDDAQRKYDFSYDNAGRLTKAAFNERQNITDAWNTNNLDFTVSGYNGKIEYDLNGNLLAMLQKGVVPGNHTVVTVDDLRYSYQAYSNKLARVTDMGNLGANNGKLGDFTDGGNSADDYIYDDNGNLIIDLNKNIKDANGGVSTSIGVSGIKYNFLDKPEEIKIAGKGTIKFVYDADGNRLQKLFTKEGETSTTVTTYINDFVYRHTSSSSGNTDAALQYINFEEGRLRPVQAVSLNNGFDYLTIDGNIDMPHNQRGAYDFFIRDYQENVRMILTEEVHTGSNSCSLELNRAANEEPVFGKVNASGTPAADNEVKLRFAISGIPGQSAGSGWTNNTSAYVSRIGNLAAKKLGPNVLLKVMAGDEISANTMYYYKEPVQNQAGGSSFVPDVITGLVNALSGGVGGSILKDNAGIINTQLTGSIPFSSLAQPDYNNAGTSLPKAYLSVIFFDERFNVVEEGSLSKRVEQPGADAPDLTILAQKAPKNGYCYVYVSNESDEMVYFDNLQVTHNHARIIEENHYYAYGLKIAAISSKKLPDAAELAIKNNYLYNDKELDDEGDLDWYNYGFRNYDPQIGRFIQIDPWAERYMLFSTYHYGGLNPITNVDIGGLGIGDLITLPNVVIKSSVKTSVHAAGSITNIVLVAASKITLTVTSSIIQSMVSNLSIQVGTNSQPDPPTAGEQLSIDKGGFITNSRVNQTNRIPKTERSNPKRFGTIILHRTVSGSANSTFNVFKNSKKGVHFVIDQDGTIYQVASLNKYTVHIYEGKQKKAFKWVHNNNTIGIEHVGNYNQATKTWDPVSPEMAKSSAWLVNSLMITYQLQQSDIQNHETVQDKTPGEGGTVRTAITPYLENPTWHPPMAPDTNTGLDFIFNSHNPYMGPLR